MLDPKTLVKGEEDKAPAKEHRKQAGSPVKPHWGQQPKGGGGRGAPIVTRIAQSASVSRFGTSVPKRGSFSYRNAVERVPDLRIGRSLSKEITKYILQRQSKG